MAIGREGGGEVDPEDPNDSGPEADQPEENSGGVLMDSETVVIATRYPERAEDVPVAVTYVGKREILEKNARTPAEALRRKPGIWVQKTGHLGGSPILRGFMGNRVIYLFDGIRRNTAGLFGGPNSFLQNIDALDMDRIEVIRGPGSVLYGSDAIGGVINVISNETPRFTSTPEFGGRIYSRFGSVDQEVSGRVEGSFSDRNIYGFVGATYRDIDDLRGGRGVGVQSPSGWNEQNFDAQMNFRLSDTSTAEFFVQDFSRPEGFRYDRPNWVQSNDRELYGARYRGYELGFVESLEVTGYYHDQRSFIDEKFWDSDGRDQTLGFDLQATSFPTRDLRLVYGVHANVDNVEKSNPQSGTVDPSVDWFNVAAFALGNLQATDRLRLDLGLRWDEFLLNSQAPALGQLDPVLQGAINNGAFALDDLNLDQRDGALTGGLGAVYGLTEETSLVGHIGRAFRAPNKSDLLSFGQFSFGFNVPSPDLEPESSWTYEVAVRKRNEAFAGSVTAFYTELHDAIVSAPGTFNGSSYIDVNGNGVSDPGEDVYVKANSDGIVRATGIEVEARHRFPDAWRRALVGSNELTAYGNFAWIYGEDTGSGEPLDRAYPANALLGIRIDQARNPSNNQWWVELETWLVRKFDRIPSNRKTSDPAYFVDPQDKTSGLIGGDGSLPGFGIVNLRGGRRIGRSTNIYLGVENLTDNAYRVKDSRIDGPGINFVFGLDISL